MEIMLKVMAWEAHTRFLRIKLRLSINSSLIHKSQNLMGMVPISDRSFQRNLAANKLGVKVSQAVLESLILEEDLEI